MVYTAQTWANSPSTSSPISAARLQYIEDGIAGLGVWVDYTPTTSNVDLTGATMTARYTQMGKTVIGRVRIIFVAAAPVSGSVNIGLPVTSNGLDGTSSTVYGYGSAYDSSINTAFTLNLLRSGTTSFALRCHSLSGSYLRNSALSSTVPFTWATADEINIWFCYEAA